MVFICGTHQRFSFHVFERTNSWGFRQTTEKHVTILNAENFQQLHFVNCINIIKNFCRLFPICVAFSCAFPCFNPHSNPPSLLLNFPWNAEKAYCQCSWWSFTSKTSSMLDTNQQTQSLPLYSLLHIKHYKCYPQRAASMQETFGPTQQWSMWVEHQPQDTFLQGQCQTIEKKVQHITPKLPMDTSGETKIEDTQSLLHLELQNM